MNLKVLGRPQHHTSTAHIRISSFRCLHLTCSKLVDLLSIAGHLQTSIQYSSATSNEIVQYTLRPSDLRLQLTICTKQATECGSAHQGAGTPGAHTHSPPNGSPNHRCVFGLPLTYLSAHLSHLDLTRWTYTSHQENSTHPSQHFTSRPFPI